MRHGVLGASRCRGVAAVEFVIAVPVLLLVMLAVAELGRAFIQYDTLSYSIRSSARYVSENVLLGGKIVIDADVVETAGNLAAYGSPKADGIQQLPNFGPGDVHVRAVDDNHVEVWADYAYEPMLPIFGERGWIPLVGTTMHVSVIMRAIS